MTDNIDATRLSKSTFGFNWFFDPPKRWYYNSEWGIMHATGCAICANHFRHIPGDTDVDESYRCAKQQRDAEFEKCYSEGYRAGRIAQKAHDKKRLKSYSSRLTAARAQISLLEARHDKLEKAGSQLEAVLNVFETAWNELKHVNSSLRADDCNSWVPDSDNDSVSEGDDDNDDDDCDYEDGKDGQGDEGGDNEHDDQTEEDDRQGREEEEKEDDAPFPSDSGREEGEDSDRLEGGSNIEDDTGDNESKETPTNHPLHCPSPPSPLAVNDDLFAAQQQATDTRPLHRTVHISVSTSHSTVVSPPDAGSNSTKFKFVTALEEIRRKTMITHFPGQKEESTEIKSLVSEAHRTSCWQRTGVQNIFLSEWRRPSPTPPLAIDVPSGREEVNVYVDASKVGIGFYSEGRWQAWRLKEGWKQAKTRDVQWAEAVAVEMGIRLLLEDSASYRGKKIRLYSDNEDVVKAMSAEDFYRVQVGRIVRIFQDICLFNGLDCTIRWIRGSKNPADAPSRLATSLEKHQRFPRDVIIPPRLRDFVLPYHLSS